MKCQNLFSGKNKKNVLNFLLKRVLSVKNKWTALQFIAAKMTVFSSILDQK